jgi:hypothetical protein
MSELSSARYAIYLAPPPQTRLWTFGSMVLGYDAATGEETGDFIFDGFAAAEWRRLSANARIYGFHATLKAPFRLKPGTGEAELIGAIKHLAAATKPFPIGRLVLAVLENGDAGGFLALVPKAAPPDLSVLERKVVTELDVFRAALLPDDIARRRPEGLTDRQRDQLMRYGYPYVFDDFRLHFTLSDRLANAEATARYLQQTMINRIGRPSFMADALVLFEQAAPGEYFRIRGRFPLGNAA